MSKIKIPTYSLSEELINSISHGIGALLSIAGLVLMIIKSNSPIEYVTTTLFGTTMILLYTMSSIYHALSKRINGKKVLRVLDHCNVYLLLLGTYIPISLLGVKNTLGWILFSIVLTITYIGIILSSISLDKFQILEVVCHLINGWSIILGIKSLYINMSINGIILLVIGGLFYSIGAILYGLGSHKKYMHSIFHFFCLFGTLFHFFAIYFYLL